MIKVKIDDQTKQIIVLLLAALGIIAYTISINITYGVFQNTKLTDPLAAIHSLSPSYYIAIVLMAMAILIAIVYGIRNRGIQIFLLIAFATMLWFTPYYLAGFAYQPDGPWHVGVALKIPEVLSSSHYPDLWYSQNYPNSYIFHYIFINICGIEPLSYVSEIFPFLRLCIFILICYVFIDSLFDSQIAFFSSALMIPGLHYIQLHPSPASIGIILVFTVLLLFMKTGVLNKVLTFLLIIIVVAVHPVSPLLLLIFVGAAFVIGFLKKPGKQQIILAAMIIICLAGWLLWPKLQLSNASEAVMTSVEGDSAQRIINAIVEMEFDTSREFLMGTPFLYSNIYNLNKAIYLIYLLLAVVLLLYIVVTSYLRQRDFKNWISGLGGLSHNQMFLAISLPILLILIVLLAEGSHDLMERALTPVILVLSCLIVSGALILWSKRWMKIAVSALLVFLTISFPVIAYSIGAYTSFPQSEKVGVEFLSTEHINENEIIVGNNVGQLHLYSDRIQVIGGLITEKKMAAADILVLRNTDYYYISLRRDLSFDNRFTKLREQLKTDITYNKNYQNPSFEVYEKIK